MGTWRLQIRDPRGALHDFFVTGEPTSTTAELEQAIDEAGFHARPLGARGDALIAHPTLVEAGLQNGDIITSGRIDPSCPDPGAGWYVMSVCGPDAGRVHQLHPDAPVTIGRSTACSLALDDALLSNVHCEVRLTDGSVVLADRGSTNGTFIETAELTGPSVVERGQYIHVGSTILAVAQLSPDDLAVVGEPDGPDRVFARQYRRALPPLPDRMEAPKTRDVDDAPVSSGWWRSAIPLVSGAGFALLTGRWIFLLISALAPIIFTLDALKRRKRTVTRANNKQARYEAEVAEFRLRLTELRRVERLRMRESNATGGLAVLTATSLMSSLWERSIGDPDFLHLAVGLASMPSGISIATTGTSFGPGGEDEIDAMQWATPVATDLLATGSLAVIGEPRRTMGVARGLVLSLATQHSPSDLRITVLTRDVDGAEWGFARWLPHTFQGEQGCRIGTDATSRAELFTSISQVLETRKDLAENAKGGSPLMPHPIHLVVIDDTELLTPAELTDLLVHGPANGIVAITLDARLAPEGTGATLTLSAAADQCVFQSRHQPRVEGVSVAEMSSASAERAARRLASLRPTRSDEASLAAGVVHLVDLVQPAPGQAPGAAITAEGVEQRWSALSPHTDVVVGMASNTPMHVDLVRDGPHGLVGGTSGSGKTEFLKTLFCALALNNHPDDLSIVIVDFKGGVDHEAVKPLPHVIDVATNLDIEQFRRTIVLLKAESRRRQDLLSTVGASNIDSYRLARAERPDIPALPRLLVVVDEFGELLASEGGREQLKELESITRIGRALGLHLLLVTQNFDGNLPPQIDANAGMRICLRVQKPVHSKAVLDSGIAASISDRNVGRAYARFHGRDLTEFQTARVAGRRRDLASADATISTRLVPFSVLAVPPPTSRPEDVPVTETDMYVLLESIRGAAAATGWTRSAVPWPTSLPEHVSMSSVAGRAGAGAVVVGVADVPVEQRRVPCAITERDQQFVFLGGPNAPLPELLATYATGLALSASPDDVHIYAIDLLGRSLSTLAELPHCGGVAVRNDALALRMVRWMAQVAAERKVAIAATGSSTMWEHGAITGEMPPQIVLLVSGAERLMSSSDGPTANLLGPLVSLMSEAVGVRMQIVLAGLPKIVGHRLGMNVERRFVFQLSDPGEYSGIGVPKSAASDLRIDRRAMEVTTGRFVQFAQLAEPGASDGAIIRTVGAALAPATVRPPKRFADVSWPLPWEQAPHDRLVVPSHLMAGLPIGVGTDDGDWLWVDAEDDGPVFAVVGPPKSGRSSALAAIARFAVAQGHHVINVGLSRRSPLATSADPALACRCEPAELGERLAATPGRVVVLFDDLQRLPNADSIEAAVEHRDRALIVVAGPPDLLSSRTGMLRGLPQANAGLLLAPSGSLDGSAIGLRRLPAELTSNPRPGRGILAIAGEATEIQMPHVVF